MKILILSLAFAPYSGVGAARMTSLARYLVSKENQVTVVCYDSKIFGKKEQTREIPQNVQIVVAEKLNEKWKNIKHLEKQIEQVVKNVKFDLCITSVGPYDTMFFIHKMQKKWGIPYIIDYRDPWLFEKAVNRPKGLRKYKIWLKDILLAGIEKRNIKWATKIVLVTQKCKQDIIERYHLTEDKCEVIYNGYEDMPEKIVQEPNNKLVLAIAGKFSYYNEEAALNFMVACQELREELPIKLIHIGAYEEQISRTFPDVYEGKGENSHAETMLELQKADALLIIYAHTSGLGTKVFDYIALNKPIIYVGAVPSELADFVQQFDNSYVCEKKEEIKSAIRKLVVCKDVPLTNESNLEKFSREYQNEIYNFLIEKLKV